MARLPRLSVAGLPHLVEQGGHNAQAVFLDGIDRSAYRAIGARGELPPFAGVDARLLDDAADVIVATLERHVDRARVLRSGLVDPLTGWHSPRYLQARLREEIARAQREQGSVACLVADVDRLQLLNDALGQSASDRVLRVGGPG